MSNDGDQSFDRNFEEGAEIEETTSAPQTEGNRGAKSQGLTEMVEDTLNTQLERQTTANRTIDQWEERGQTETETLTEQYQELVDSIPETADWDLDRETPAEQLVEELTYDGELGVRDYAEHQSEQIEGLTGTIRRFRGMMDGLNEEIQGLEEERSDLNQQEEIEKAKILDQVEQMDDEDLDEEQTFGELESYERRSLENSYDRKRAEVEEEIDNLAERLTEVSGRKQDRASERAIRRDETQQVYNEFASEAESVINNNYDGLRESLKVLRDLEMQQQKYEQLSVEASNERSSINQGQQEQYEARREAGLAYVAEALDEIDEIEDVVSDHESVVKALSSPAQVNTRDMESLYDGLVDPSYAEEGDDYSTEALRNRVLDAASSITGESYDSLRELRDIVDEME